MITIIITICLHVSTVYFLIFLFELIIESKYNCNHYYVDQRRLKKKYATLSFEQTELAGNRETLYQPII